MNNFRSALDKGFKVLLSTVCVVISGKISAGGSCPAVQCDCTSLPTESWRVTCSVQEKKLVNQCIANAGTPTDYCIVHGPSGFPVPVALELDQHSFGQTDNGIDEEIKLSEAVQWALHSDTESFNRLVKLKSYAKAGAVLKIIDRNLATIFNKQRKISLAYEMNDDYDNAEKVWKSNSEQTLVKAERMKAVGVSLWKKRSSGVDAETDKALRILSLKMLRTTSKAYEVVARGYANAGLDEEAAKSWKSASDVSSTILAHRRSDAAPKKHIEYYSKQAAMRLMRASYYWEMGKRPEDAQNSIKMAGQFVTEKDMINSLLTERERPLEPREIESIAGSQ